MVESFSKMFHDESLSSILQFAQPLVLDSDDIIETKPSSDNTVVPESQVSMLLCSFNCFCSENIQKRVKV